MPFATWPKVEAFAIRLEMHHGVTLRVLVEDRFPKTVALSDDFFEIADKSAVRVDTGAGTILFLLSNAYARYSIVEHDPEVKLTLCELIEELVF